MKVTRTSDPIPLSDPPQARRVDATPPAPSPAAAPREDNVRAWGFELSPADLADDDHDLGPLAGGALERVDSEPDVTEPEARPLGSWVHAERDESHAPSEPLGGDAGPATPKATGISRDMFDLPDYGPVRIEASSLRERLQVDAPTRAGRLMEARRAGKGLRGALGVDDG